MIDFATLQGLSIPEGVVTQIADAAGNVLWKLVTNKPVILEVEKITADTYAGETTYTGEQFILLDIYPKTNGTVSVTYGGLTKTITDTSGSESPNAQTVYFGTFNGVSDSVTTPASGTMTIVGDYETFGSGIYNIDNKKTEMCKCIKDVVDWGSVTTIAASAFQWYDFTTFDFPQGVTSIGTSAFNGCTNLALTSLPDSVTSIGDGAFNGCTNLALTSLPANLISIGHSAFKDCCGINIRDFPPNLVSIGTEAFYIASELDDKITSHAMYNATITLPNTIQSIGDDAFRTNKQYLAGEYQYYTYIAGVKIHATTPPTIGEDTFGTGGMSHGLKAKITASVPTGCGEAYKAAQYWRSLNIVEGV